MRSRAKLAPVPGLVGLVVGPFRYASCKWRVERSSISYAPKASNETSSVAVPTDEFYGLVDHTTATVTFATILASAATAMPPLL